MCDLFAGICGIVVGVAVFGIMWLFFWLVRNEDSFDFDAQGQSGEFEKRLAIYFDIFKLVLGLAAGSIVLLVGSSALRQSEHLPTPFASPLFLLTLSILYGILCMVFLATNYESYRHGTSPYTRFMYSRNQA